jgi:hypothetical protein
MLDRGIRPALIPPPRCSPSSVLVVLLPFLGLREAPPRFLVLGGSPPLVPRPRQCSSSVLRTKPWALVLLASYSASVVPPLAPLQFLCLAAPHKTVGVGAPPRLSARTLLFSGKFFNTYIRDPSILHLAFYSPNFYLLHLLIAASLL